MRNLFDPKEYKHVTTGKDFTVLKHRKGHQIRIAHNVLSPQHKAMLSALAKVGEENQTESQKQEAEDQHQYGKVIMKKDGGRIAMNDGGNTGDKVQVPDSNTGDSTSSAQQNLKDAAKVETTGTDKSQASTASSPSQIWSNIKNGWAEGGYIKSGVHKPYETQGHAIHGAMRKEGFSNTEANAEHRHQHKRVLEEQRAIKPNLKGLADGGPVVPYGMDKSDIPKADAAEHYREAARLAEKAGDHTAGQAPRDEAQTEQDLDQFEAAEPPTVRQQATTNRMNARMSPELQPGMPGYEPANPVTDTQNPPSVLEDMDEDGSKTNKAMYDKIHQPDNLGHPEQQDELENELNQPPNPANMTQPQGQNGQVQPQAQQSQQDPNAMQIPQTQMQQPQTIQDRHIATKTALNAEDQAFQQDLNNGHITPKTYGDLFARKSTLGKIGQIFGLIIGGAGAGLTGKENPVLQMMNKEIEQDLEAQKASKTNAYNFKQLNLQRLMQEGQLGQMQAQNINTIAGATNTLQEANIKSDALAHMQANRAALHTLADNLKTLAPGTPAYASAQQALAMVAQGVDEKNSDIADKAAAMSSLLQGTTNQPQQDPETQFQNQQRMLRMSGRKDIAEDNESRHLPGVNGSSSEPIPPQVRDQFAAKRELHAMGSDLLNYVSTHTNLVPGTAEYNTGVAKANNLRQAYRTGVLGGVFKPSESPLLDMVVSQNPAGAFKTLNSIPKLKEMLNLNNISMNSMKKSAGFPEEQVQTNVNADKIAAATKWLSDPNNAKRPEYPAIQAYLKKLSPQGK